MLTQNFPESLIDFHEFEDVPGKNPTSGGSSDTDTKDPIVIPNGLPSELHPVTTTTDVGACPRTARKTEGSMFEVTDTQ